MNIVRGTKGYELSISSFIEATEAVDFNTLHRPYLDLIPDSPSRVLDIGAGVGRDANMLASMGHTVTAVEPMPDLLQAGRHLHTSQSIRWVDDSLPELAKIGQTEGTFEFVLASGVWHHINNAERSVALSRISELLSAGGIFAVSLRNGPAGVGTHLFPTNSHQTIDEAKSYGLEAIVVVTEQPSLIKGKSRVKWAKLAFRRR